MTEKTISMKGLPFTPIDPAWLAESDAFLSGDPRVVRASVALLNYAWRSTPAGSIPAGFRAIGGITGLSEQEVGDHHDALTQGWELRDGRYHHIAMSALCERIANKFSEALIDLSERSAALMQAPEDFELTAPEVRSSASKGKRLLPKDFAMTQERKLWLNSNGFSTPEDQEFIFTKFVSHCKSNGIKMTDWNEAFINFALKENRRNLPSAIGVLVPLTRPGSRADRFGTGAAQSWGTRGEASASHNASVLSRTARRDTP